MDIIGFTLTMWDVKTILLICEVFQFLSFTLTMWDVKSFFSNSSLVQVSVLP